MTPTNARLSHRPRDSAKGRKLAAGERLALGFPVVSLLDDLHAFVQNHEHCGDLDSAVEGERVWMTCTCGAVINRSADDD